MPETEFNIYTPIELYAVMFDERQTISTTHWRDFFTARPVFSEENNIAFSKIQASRKIAPFMHGNAPGRPIYSQDGETIEAFRPAYTKPKDAVVPSDHMSRTGKEIIGRVGPMTAQQRFDNAVLNITNFHREAIERLWDYMIAKVLLNGKIDVEYMTDDGLPLGQKATIDYRRSADHSVPLSSSSQPNWGTTGTNIFKDIQGKVDLVGDAEFGGLVTNILMGSKAAGAFRDYFTTGAGKAFLDLNTSGAEDVRVSRGIVRENPMNPFTYLGNLSGDLSCWKVSGRGNQFQKADGTFETIIGDWDVLYTSPGIDLIMAYGAINEATDLVATDIHVKMWDEHDPSKRFIMSQSAPLPIVVNPNGTLRATVGSG